MTEAPTVTPVIRAASRVGEGPSWDAEAEMLVWVDILACEVHRSDPRTGATSTVVLPELVGAALPMEGGGLVIASETGFGTLPAKGDYQHRLAALASNHRMNDAKCDPVGRLWSGSTAMDFEPGRGALHRLERAWSSELILDGLTLPNGLDWSNDGRTFYLVDTMERVLYAFDFDVERGAVSNRRDLIRFREGTGLPDGMTVDSAGCLWIALWGGGAVVQYSPEGRLLSTVPFPVVQPTSCAFGGTALDVLYVTSARDGLDLDESSLDGSVFAVTGTGATGTPVRRFRTVR